MKAKRPPIPLKTQIKLWTLASGRCEFAGCNKPLWRDSLTFKETNFSNIAHIISWTPRGPRGDQVLSPRLAKDFSNLMLVCLDHAKVIDSKEHITEFPKELLSEYKKDHEQRIQVQTAMQSDYRTTILRFIANIKERVSNIQLEKTYEAIIPRYPMDETGIVFDFKELDGDGNNAYWDTLAREISVRMQQYLKSGFIGKKIERLSIFAIGPIPLLMSLGASIGNIIPSDIYQLHKDTQGWMWKQKNIDNWQGFYTEYLGGVTKNNKVALLLSLSGKIHRGEVKKLVGNIPLYEVSHSHPDRDFLQTPEQLVEFRQVYRQLLGEIRKKYGSKCEIHLFPAIPVSIAVSCGMDLLPKSDPSIYVYDNNKSQLGFRLCIKLN